MRNASDDVGEESNITELEEQAANHEAVVALLRNHGSTGLR